jgi:hypothetical protein
MAYLGFDVSSAAYQLRRHRDVLVIGPGGGRDVLTALSMGSGPVTGVEINPITVELMRTRFRTFSGGLYDGFPGVTIVNDDGRSFLGRSSARYGLIEASLVDTWAASAAGAYALTENTLYTVEAFGDYFDHLTPDGIVCFNRWFTAPPVESLRLVSLAREALVRRGVANPGDHVMVVHTDPSDTMMPSLGSILVKASPFSAAEVATLRAFAADRRFVVAYTPGSGSVDVAFRELLGPNGAQFVRSYLYDISAVSDDRSFFFSRVPVMQWLKRRLGLAPAGTVAVPLGLGGQTLVVALAATAAATLVLLLLPWLARALRRGRGPTSAAAGAGAATWALYFVGLGLGFILVEIVLIQRFSLFFGYPVYSLSVVLFTILLSSAVGSLASGRLTSRRALPAALGALVAALLIYALVLPPLLGAARGAPLAARIALAIASIAPLGFLMGIPVPSGLRRAGAAAGALVPWAWAVNGGASVFGSALAVLISMTYGFTASLVAGAIAYAVALAAAASLARRAAP